MPRTPHGPNAAHRSAHDAHRRGLRRGIRIGGIFALALGLVFVVFTAAWVGTRAVEAKNALTRAQAQLTTFKSQIGQPGAPSTEKLAAELRANTALAANDTGDPLWSLTEALPIAGPDLKAFRQVADLLDALVRDGVQPVAVAANGLSVDSLKPKDGRLDIEPLKTLTPAITRLDTALGAAQTSAELIDTTGTLPQIADAKTQLLTTIDKVKPVTAELVKVLPILYPALGGDGTRHYLLMFQNNAEERASGGNPAALAMLDVSHGKVTLGKQPNSGSFPHPYHEPVRVFGGDWMKLYGPHVSTYETNITFMPDFPQVAQLARTMWQTSIGGTVDGVISFDPVALSYLLRATGPITLATGERLDSNNAVDYLLSGVYAKYPDPRQQDAVFASAAQAVFKAVTHGQGSPRAYLAQIAPMIADQRLKLWSARKAEQAVILPSPVGTMLPADNRVATTVGVYNNDDSTSKMSFYMNSTIAVNANQCTAKPTYVVSTTITDTLKPSQVAGLTGYVLPAQDRIVPGGDRQWVPIYGPVGSRFVSATVDSKKVIFGTNINFTLNTVADATGQDDHRPAVTGVLDGRPVAIVSLKFVPQQSITLTATFSGATDPAKTIAVSHTPKVRAVPVTITNVPCG